MLKRLLVAVDGSENATRAAKAAVRLAKEFEAELFVLHVIPRLSYMLPTASLLHYSRDAKKVADGWVNNVVSLAKSEGLTATGQILTNAPSVVRAISNYAKRKKVDLIVIGARGPRESRKLSIGSTSAGVASHAPCWVLVVR
jgi:nucleotide-binding universal stress UspA family protein